MKKQSTVFICIHLYTRLFHKLLSREYLIKRSLARSIPRAYCTYYIHIHKFTSSIVLTRLWIVFNLLVCNGQLSFSLIFYCCCKYSADFASTLVCTVCCVCVFVCLWIDSILWLLTISIWTNFIYLQLLFYNRTESINKNPIQSFCQLRTLIHNIDYAFCMWSLFHIDLVKKIVNQIELFWRQVTIEYGNGRTLKWLKEMTVWFLQW